jgi:nitrate/TMAO reductase-like tetraheme cytochrome c subunit
MPPTALQPVSPRVRALIALLAAMAFGGVLICLPRANPTAQGEEPAAQGRAALLVSLGKKLDGAASCAGKGCHDSATPNPPPGPLMTENTTWNDLDRHSKAYASLKPKKADIAKRPSLAKTAEIAKAMGIKKPEKDSKCLSCHSLDAPENLQNEKNSFSLTEGVTCNSCHGPSQDWRDPHQQKGWTNEQRKTAAATAKGNEIWKGQAAHQELLKKFGLYDTKPLFARAEICVSCHLAIDPKMVEAGHPQPFFELNKFQEDQPKHWRERPEDAGFGHVRIWAVGQIVCMRDAMQQLADRAKAADTKPETLKDALAQALAHYSMVKQLVDAKVINAGAASLDKGKDLMDALAAPETKRDAIAAAATTLSAQANVLANPSLEMAADQATTAKLLSAVAADSNVPKTLGRHGAQQQAMAIWSLYNASPSAKPDDAANKAIESLLSASTGDPAAYTDALGKAQTILPK